MKKNKLFKILIGVAILATVGMITYGLRSMGITNDLGLTRSDLAMGGHSDIEALRTKTTATADFYLSQHGFKLKDVCQEPGELNIDNSLKSKIRSLGYRSSFYYSHWDIYLPYTLKAQSDNPHIFIVQVSDINGNIHDSNNKFRVIRVIVIDMNGLIVKQLENNAL